MKLKERTIYVYNYFRSYINIIIKSEYNTRFDVILKIYRTTATDKIIDYNPRFDHICLDLRYYYDTNVEHISNAL